MNRILQLAYRLGDCDPISEGGYLVDLIDAIDTHVDKVLRGKRQHEWANALSDLDQLYEIADTTQISAVGLIALARTVYSVRLHLPHWKEFVQRSKLTLDTRGYNTQRIMCGLID